MSEYEGCSRCNAGLEATTGCCYECDDLRAGITRAEADLTEARALAQALYHGRRPEMPLACYPWLTEAL